MQLLNQAAADSGVETASARDLAALMRNYSEPSLRRALFELAVTAGPFATVIGAMVAAVQYDLSWLALLLAVPAAGLLLRLFMIQHDCGHGAFFPHRSLNRWVGRIIGVFTLTPFDYWARSHAIHHASSGDLDRRGIGDIDTLTVQEYLALSRWGRFSYRFMRNPLVMFGLGPIVVFGLRNRLPFGLMRAGWRPWISAMGTNIAIAALAGSAAALIGWGSLLTVGAPVIFLAGAVGIWLFYVQHQFEDTHWDRRPGWTLQAAAIQGSSYYDLPQPLRWLSANIGVHHVHHLSSRVPFYRLGEVLRDVPELKTINRLTLWESFGCLKLSLWDEARGRLISFRELRTGTAVPASA